MKPIRIPNKFTFGSAILILFICLALFSIDKDTHQVSDLWRMGNIIALIVYFLPTYFVCYLLYFLFASRQKENPGIWALVIGIPFALGGIILVLSWWMGRI